MHSKYVFLCIFESIKFIKMRIFSKENTKPFLITLAAVMVGLAVHQMVVAPKIADYKKK